MPTFDNFAESQTTKMIYLGDSGAGKTGSLVSLAAAGYNVRILDIDKGVEVIADFVKNPQSPYRKAHPGLWTAEQAETLSSRISFVEIDDDISVQAGKVLPAGKIWERTMKQLNDWNDGEAKFGNIGTWTPQDVLAIDGLSRLCDAAFDQQLKLNGRMGQRPEQWDYNAAQNAVKTFLKWIYSKSVNCNIVMICHIAAVEIDGQPTRGFPQSIGKALAPQIGQFFNHALLAKQSGQGEAIKREIHTNTAGMVQLKSSAPLRVKAKYDLSTGLAEYFRDVRGGAKPGPKAP